MFKLLNIGGVTESGDSEKALLLMESGVRLHTTAYVWDNSNTPSGFTLKLRKHVRTRRLEDVWQLGCDRLFFSSLGWGLTANPVINFAGVLGNETLALRTELSFDSSSGNVTKCMLDLDSPKARLVLSAQFFLDGQ